MTSYYSYRSKQHYYRLPSRVNYMCTSPSRSILMSSQVTATVKDAVCPTLFPPSLYQPFSLPKIQVINIPNFAPPKLHARRSPHQKIASHISSILLKMALLAHHFSLPKPQNPDQPSSPPLTPESPQSLARQHSHQASYPAPKFPHSASSTTPDSSSSINPAKLPAPVLEEHSGRPSAAAVADGTKESAAR